MRRARRPATRTCKVDGCEAVIPGWQVICTRHFWQLPQATRDQIAEARADKAPHRVSQLLLDGAVALSEAEQSRVAAAAARTASMIGERE